MDWVNCKECIYFQEGDCTETESRDGCYYGATESDVETETDDKIRFLRGEII